MNKPDRLAGALCALLLAAPLAAQARPTSAPSPSATIATGSLQGAVEDGVSVFRGIPFAAPPVGALRWRPPAAPAAWTGARDATRFGPACPQGHIAGRDAVAYGGAPEPTSEDCLTLNVWAPAKPAPHTPVMVFIHGGSGVIGAGSLPYYDGKAFARDGVVLVTINYRLGALGGFAHPALTRDAKPGELLGNYALMDQMAALRWVRRNISAFGGDPRNVTVFGESAGAVSVFNLVSTPSAKGLFDKAIIESGGGWFPPGPSREKAEAIGVKVAQTLGLPANATAAQLRRLPAAALMSRTLPSAAFTDPRLALEGMTTAIDAERQTAVPLIIGVNSGEDTLLGDARGIAKARATIKPDEMAQLRKLYGPVGDETLVRDKFRDGIGTAPARWVARKWSAKAPAYLYYFQHVDQAQLPARTRAPHGGELFYVFETLGLQPSGIGAVAPTPTDQRIAEDVHARWVAFARTGSPNAPGHVNWPAYSGQTDPWMVFGQNGVAVQDHMMKPQLDWHESKTAPLIVLLRLSSEWTQLFH